MSQESKEQFKEKRVENNRGSQCDSPCINYVSYEGL